MRRETQTSYGTNSMLAIKINIVLEINVNNSSSADKREDTDDLKTFFRILPIKLFILKLADQLATLQFEEALKEKQRKHLLGSGEWQRKRKAERKWRASELRWKFCEKLTLADQVLTGHI